MQRPRLYRTYQDDGVLCKRAYLVGRHRSVLSQLSRDLFSQLCSNTSCVRDGSWSMNMTRGCGEQPWQMCLMRGVGLINLILMRQNLIKHLQTPPPKRGVRGAVSVTLWQKSLNVQVCVDDEDTAGYATEELRASEEQQFLIEWQRFCRIEFYLGTHPICCT